MYLIYSKHDGQIWREVENYTTEKDGTIKGGFNGKNNLVYPPELNVAVKEISLEKWAEICDNIKNHKIENGEIVEKFPIIQNTLGTEVIDKITAFVGAIETPEKPEETDDAEYKLEYTFGEKSFTWKKAEKHGHGNGGK